MKTKELNELRKAKTPKEILYLYAHNKITLTDKQISNLIDEKYDYEKAKEVAIKFNLKVSKLKKEGSNNGKEN